MTNDRSIHLSLLCNNTRAIMMSLCRIILQGWGSPKIRWLRSAQNGQFVTDDIFESNFLKKILYRRQIIT